MQFYKKSKRVVTSLALFYNSSLSSDPKGLVQDNILGVLVENMYLLKVHSQLYSITRSCGGTRIYLGGEVCIINIKVQKNLRT